MPYLHWETDRQREKFALEIEHFTESKKDERKAEEEVKRGNDVKNEAVFQKFSLPSLAQSRKEMEISRSTSRPEALGQITKTVSRRQAVMDFHPYPISLVKNRTKVACANGCQAFERRVSQSENC
jgi:hypothetical protein